MAEGPHVPEPEAPPAAATPVGAEEWEKFLGEIDDRLDAQTTQTRRLMEPFAGLTGAAQTLVEIKTQSARMLGLLNDHLEQARAIEATERSVDAAVGRLGDATERQSESLDKVRERVEANTQAIRRAAETYERVTEELQEVVRAICKAQEDVGTLARSLQDHDSRLARSVSRLEKRLLLLGGAASLAAVVALALGVLGLV
jgi:chromosome segregation ATPase